MNIYHVSTDLEAARRVRALRQRFAGSLGLLVGIGLASTVAFVILGDADAPLADRWLDAFWDTINLVSTVGSLSRDLTVGQRVWASLVIVFGLGAVLYAFGSLQQLLHGEDVRRHLGSLRMRARLQALRGHVVICGYGSVGAALAGDLRRSGTPAMVIERDEAAAGRAAEAGFPVIHGDATDESVLAEAGLEHASGLAAVLDDDASNTFLTLIVRERAPTLRIVARAARDSTCSSLTRAGADRVIVPGRLAGVQMSHLIRKPRVGDFVAAAIGDGEFEFGELAVAEHPWLGERPLGELGLDASGKLLVIGVLRADGHSILRPGPEVRLEPADVLLVVTSDGGLPDAVAAARVRAGPSPAADA